MKRFKAKVEAFFMYLITRLIGATYRFDFRDREKFKEIGKIHPNGSYIIACWHQNIIASILANCHRPHVCIVSPSNDGEHVALTLKFLGHVTARGSSSRGGAQAMLEMIHYIDDGYPGAITVDGPRGPALQPKKGVFEIAKVTGAPIVPLITLPEKYWEFNSWDKFRLPKPFTKILVRYGEPMVIDKNVQASDWPRLSEELTAQLRNGEFAAMREFQGN